jgi:hypothetical protein
MCSPVPVLGGKSPGNTAGGQVFVLLLLANMSFTFMLGIIKLSEPQFPQMYTGNNTSALPL